MYLYNAGVYPTWFMSRYLVCSQARLLSISSSSSLLIILALPNSFFDSKFAIMGAGGKPQNIFKLNRGDDPKEVLNWKLWLAVFSFGIMGAARGVDEGLISGTLASKNFRAFTGLDKLSLSEFENTKANISSMVQIGSVAGAGLAFVLCDRIGRLWATRQLCLLWILGIVIFLTNGGRVGQIYAG